MREQWQRCVPDEKDISRAIGVCEIRSRSCTQTHRGLPLGERLRTHHAKELFTATKLAVAGKFDDVNFPACTMYHRPKRRRPKLARLARNTFSRLPRNRELITLERMRDAIQNVIFRLHRIGIKRVELVEVLRVISRRPSEVSIKSTDDRKRSADPK